VVFVGAGWGWTVAKFVGLAEVVCDGCIDLLEGTGGADGELASTGLAGKVFEYSLVATAVGVVDGVDHDVCSLCLTDGIFLVEVASVISAVGEEHHGSTAHLRAEFDVGDGDDGIEEEGTAAARRADHVMRLGEVGKPMHESRLIGCEFDELQDAVVELDEDGAVVWSGEHGGEEGSACGDLVGDVCALGAAGVDHEGEGERQTGALREVGDGLRLAILLELEVVAGEVGDGLAGLVACDGGDGDDAGGDFERGGVWREGGG